MFRELQKMSDTYAGDCFDGQLLTCGIKKVVPSFRDGMVSVAATVVYKTR